MVQNHEIAPVHEARSSARHTFSRTLGETTIGRNGQANQRVQRCSRERGQEEKLEHSSPPLRIQLLPITSVLIVVTLGVIGSMLFLASAHKPSQASPLRTLLVHIPPLSVLLLGGLAVLGVCALVVGWEGASRRVLPPLRMNEQALLPPHYQAHVELLLMRLYARVLTLSIEHVRGDSDFFQCGGDSDALTALLSEIERQFGTRLVPDEVFEHPVLFRLAAFLVQKQQSSKTKEEICK